MSIKALFFDLDGTLVDSLDDLADAVNYARSTFSLPPLTQATVRNMIGKGARNLIQQALPDADETEIDSALETFLVFNNDHIADKSRLYPGIVDVLGEFASRKLRLAVITNKNETLSRLLLTALGVAHLFDCIIGGDTCPERKPSPLPLFRSAELLGIQPDECVMVGDSINDIEAARRAQMTAVGCTWGYGDAAELANAEHIINTPLELVTLMNSMSERSV